MGKKNKASSNQPVVSPGKKGYFASGRLAKLPINVCYLTRTTLEGFDYIHVGVTRKHSNGNISYGVFGVSAAFGRITEVVFDFNFPQEDFDILADNVQFKPFDDLKAIEQLISDCELISKTAGLPIPYDFNLAKRILSEPLDEWKEISQNKLAYFQKQRIREPFDEKNSKQKDQQAAAIYDTYIATIYEPEKVRYWEKPDWEAFLEKFNSFTRNDIYEKGHTPLCYLFEKNMLQDYPTSGPFQEAFRKLSSISPKLTKQKANDTYKPSSYEILMDKGIEWALESVKSERDGNKVLPALQQLIADYPKNPTFYKLLSQFYYKIGPSDAALATAIDNYRRFPLLDFAFANYFKEILVQHQVEKIESFFKKGYLIEDHFPKDFEFDEIDYHFYYLALGDYLNSINEYGALWTLYGIIAQMESFKNSALVQKGWQDSLAQPIELIRSRLLFATDSEREKILNNTSYKIA